MQKKKTIHSAVTGKFVSKEEAKANPETTVEVTSCNLRKELKDFFIFFRNNGEDLIGISIEELVDQYLRGK